MRNSAGTRGTDHPTLGESSKCEFDPEVAISTGVEIYDGKRRKTVVNQNSVEPTTLAQVNTFVRIAGELASWPAKHEMASLLRRAGLSVTVGPYSIRLEDCEHFVFQEYGGNIRDPSIDADADSLDHLLHDAGRVSRALADTNIRHRFENYDHNDVRVGYLHHDYHDTFDCRAPPTR